MSNNHSGRWIGIVYWTRWKTYATAALLAANFSAGWAGLEGHIPVFWAIMLQLVANVAIMGVIIDEPK